MFMLASFYTVKLSLELVFFMSRVKKIIKNSAVPTSYSFPTQISRFWFILSLFLSLGSFLVMLLIRLKLGLPHGF